MLVLFDGLIQRSRRHELRSLRGWQAFGRRSNPLRVGRVLQLQRREVLGPVQRHVHIVHRGEVSRQGRHRYGGAGVLGLPGW